MNKEDIIRMAREAGIFTGGHPMNSWSVCPSDLERFAALVAAAAVEKEREACAKLCDYLWEYKASEAYECATAIRKRGDYE